MQLTLPEIKKLGANLVAISPQLLDTSAATAQKNSVDYDVLSDVGNKVAGRFGLVFNVPEKYHEAFKKFGIDLPAVNGGEGWELPMTPTYVIDVNGILSTPTSIPTTRSGWNRLRLFKY